MTNENDTIHNGLNVSRPIIRLFDEKKVKTAEIFANIGGINRSFSVPVESAKSAISSQAIYAAADNAGMNREMVQNYYADGRHGEIVVEFYIRSGHLIVRTIGLND